MAWHVRAGDVVSEDAPLVDVMTDKATVEMTAPVSGRIISIHGEPGEMAPVGSAIAIFETDVDAVAAEAKPEAKSGAAAVSSPVYGGSEPREARDEGGGSAPLSQSAARPDSSPHRNREAISDSSTTGHAATVGGGAKPRIKAPSGAVWSEAETNAAMGKPTPSQSIARTEPSVVAREWGQAHASPAVRARAQKLGIDLGSVRGTGPDGRVTHEDLDSVLTPVSGARAQSTALAARTHIEPVKVIGLRRKIAEKMQDAKRRIPHFAYVEECDLTELEDLRAHLNATKRNDQPKLTVLPFIMRALALSLPDFPQINARYDDDQGVVYRHEAVDIGIATQTDNGLIVPVVRHVEARDIWSCAAEVSRVAAAVRSNNASKDELSGSTITITSLGALGGVVTTPVINHPEVAIIGVNKLIERPMVKNSQIVGRKMMNLSSSFDHRVVDGYDAAAFIQRVKGMLEHPASLFM